MNTFSHIFLYYASKENSFSKKKKKEEEEEGKHTLFKCSIISLTKKTKKKTSEARSARESEKKQVSRQEEVFMPFKKFLERWQK